MFESDNQTRIRVKFLTRNQPSNGNYDNWLRRFPTRKPSWGRCDFIFEQECSEYDWLVVYDDFPRRPGSSKLLWEEPLGCSPSQTMLLTAEPSSIKIYGQGFLHQFGYILTSQEPWAIRHPGAIYRQIGHIWYYGMQSERGTWDSLDSTSPWEKGEDISTVCSSKQMRHTLHQNRYDFTQQLKADLPELEIFGHGVRPIEDKADALDNFRYHLSIENHISRHHWTEKLSDPFLAYCLPFYCGCPNAADYFPEESFVPVDITRYGETLETIRRTIRDNEYNRRLPAIREARRLILEEYGTFPQLSSLIEERHDANARLKPGTVIQSRRLWRKKHPLGAASQLLEKSAVQLCNRLAHRGFRNDS
ncbi:glycosyltransferase family 10 domain-containing protein [Luteolibacter algae]|uniref:Glycosyltransferase family 10 domain-containing protein n=1 Tax=Luteolibacter algae TaxID=454151 RepID=A0ABW5DAA7_9BACT